MPVLHRIAAAGRLYIAAAAAPQTVRGGLYSTNTVANIYNRTAYVKGFQINPTLGTDNVTTLDCDLANFSEVFVAALRNATGSLEVLWGAPQGTFRRALNDIMNGENHTVYGRGAVDFIYDPWGTTEGYHRIKGSIILTALPLNAALGTAVGGTVSFQATGEITESTVPAQAAPTDQSET